MPRYIIYVNGTTDEDAVTQAYSFIQRRLRCRGFDILSNEGRGGIRFSVESESSKEEIVAALAPHLPKGAYAG